MLISFLILLFFALNQGVMMGKNVYHQDFKKNPSFILSTASSEKNVTNFKQDYVIIYHYKIEIGLHFKLHHIIQYSFTKNYYITDH